MSRAADKFLRAVWAQQPVEDGAVARLATKHYSGDGDWEEYEPQDPRRPSAPTTDDLYFAPTLFAGSRANDNALASRWLYADLDEADPRTLSDALRPTLAWGTSPGRWQGAWLLDRPVGGDRFAALNKALTYETGADKGGWMASKVLRVPGTTSHKHDEPFRVRLLPGFTSLKQPHSVEDLERLLTPRRADPPETTAEYTEVRARLHETLPARAKALLDGEVETEDRSAQLWETHCRLAEAGVPATDRFVLAKGSALNKYAGRSDEDDRLWAEVRKASEAAPVAERVPGIVAHPANLKNARPPRWAWDRWVPLGYLSLILGTEGVGKGTLASWAIAAWTRGELFGHLIGTPATVAVLGDEDSFDHVWVPRLHAAGADLDRVVQLEKPDAGFITLADDQARLAEAVKAHDVRVLYMDALLDNLGVKVDDYRAKEVRSALQPGRALARELDIAVIGSLHPNKRGGSFRELVAGSSAFNAVSRSSLLLADDPDNEGGKVLVRGKGNLSAAPDAIQFEIASHKFEANGHTFNVPRVENVEDGGDITADDLIAALSKPKLRESKIAQAESLIQRLLPADGEWHESRPIIEAGVAAGTTERTLRRAKDTLLIEDKRGATFPARVLWRWRPEPATTAGEE